MKPRLAVIGAGFSGLSAACYAAQAGFEVTMFERHRSPGGRARQLTLDGYTFDMGPSWYWMPDVFERFFNDFGKSVKEYYQLKLLDPGFRIHFAAEYIDVPASKKALKELFESIEPGAGKKLEQFMKNARYKYQVGMQDLVYKPGLELSEYLDRRLFAAILKLDVTTPFDRFVARYFKDKRLKQLMEFPVLFLGAAPSKTPALYSLMNYAGLGLGTWYPQGGMYQVIEGMQSLARDLGVRINCNALCQKINVENNRAASITVDSQEYVFDSIISSADYHFTEQMLLPPKFRNYSERYWQRRTMAPSCLIFFLGVKGKIKNLLHHNLFFDEDLDQHTAEIYQRPSWPSKPLFYVCCPSKSDASVAPPDCENLFILMPLSAGLEDTEQIRQTYFDKLLKRIESKTGEQIRNRIQVQKSYCIKDFVNDYGAFRGNAYGLANTLRQTALLKPKLKNSQLDNLFYTGHLTVPGPGVPPSLISGKLAAEQARKALKL